MPNFQSGSEESELAPVTRHTVTATTVIRDIMVITRAMATAITGVIHIPERIIAAGRTTTAAIVTTSITSVITTATRMQVSVRLLRWLASFGIVVAVMFANRVANLVQMYQFVCKITDGSIVALQ